MQFIFQAGTRSTMSVIPRPPLKIVARNPSAQGSVQIRPPVPQQSSYDRLAEWMKKKGALLSSFGTDGNQQIYFPVFFFRYGCPYLHVSASWKR